VAETSPFIFFGFEWWLVYDYAHKRLVMIILKMAYTVEISVADPHSIFADPDP
jgi:hypothetical protein